MNASDGATQMNFLKKMDKECLGWRGINDLIKWTKNTSGSAK